MVNNYMSIKKIFYILQLNDNLFVIRYLNSTSVVKVLIPPQRSFGVLILISQSITKTFPLCERITFSSCKSLK